MYLNGIGGQDSSVAVPTVGSDRVTTGYSPSTMHIDPTTGIDYQTESAQPAVTVVVAPSNSGPSLWLIAAFALGAWYAYKQGWFAQALEAVGIHSGGGE